MEGELAVQQWLWIVRNNPDMNHEQLCELMRRSMVNFHCVCDITPEILNHPSFNGLLDRQLLAYINYITKKNNPGNKHANC